MAPTAAAEATAAAAGAQQQHTGKAAALAARDASGHLAPLTITRRSTGDDDVAIKILYCGICHSDLHSIKNDWHNAMYPMVPGHEIAGVVMEVGKNVTKFKAGDRVGVGCMVNSCQSCDSCNDGFENNCTGIIFTYNSIDRDGTVTYGGYSSNVVVHQRFVVQFPDAMPLDQGAPLLCAGITVYSPMKYHGLNMPGKHVGVVGLGGLGHVAVKFAKAFGMKVTVISSSHAKRQEALERLGADAFVVSKNPDEMKAAVATMDGIINTVSANIPLAPFMSLLKPNGKMIMVGLPEKTLEIPPFDLIMGNKALAGTCIGGLRDTQEMIDVAAKHGVTADIEVVGADYVNTAMERLAKADVRYRFVIDIGNTLKSSE
ncbi:putative cinnamyl alcohol dehydrogenase 5 [Dichanthelium oligosanthes]|uniref:Probable cinnamyl alcohol dehydrogenase n=1 Tax=Dichanthelium oligosanthes TaxID=888268 RepID=A0A1E5WL84_9POAL|nr:putative cinnamyl alcohol dehydrogenase 5 [Dichanthelium oligosanthes]